MVEAVEPVLGLEADQIVGEHRAHQPLVEGQGHDQPLRRPGDMEEEADPVAKPVLAQLHAQWDQMIIVDPDEVVGLDQRRHRAGEALVDPLIAAAEAAVIFGIVDPIVEQRPQGAVGVAVIIFVDILLLEVDRRGGDALVPLQVDMAGELVGLVARPAEPQAAIFPQGRRQRHRQPALGAAGAARLGRRHPVGDDDQPAHRTALHGLDSSPAQLISPTSE
jgi:hypothetical protein